MHVNTGTRLGQSDPPASITRSEITVHLVDTMHDVDAHHLTKGLQASFDHIGMRYPTGTQALDDVSLTVAEGECVAIVGPSGCGKSTLLRLAAGLEAPSTGSVALGTTSVGFVFQEPNLLPWCSVRRNVGLLAHLAKVPKAEREQRVTAALDAVGLTAFADQLPRALSGGMRMRVSLARALVLRPDMMLLDEPFGALDELTRQDMQGELLRLYESRRFTMLFVTHSVAEAVLLARRVVVMSPRPGRIAATVDIDLPYPRRPEVRFSPRYVEHVAAVADILRGVR
ncbi:ABC transporter ATP-binding protein [Streptomyces specialis]|uniref:ABC transporter ATP-binding protein n=1 Tax=Streptomyces specialis TaxID=498367 RepID=UPI001F268DD9|nr:ABC transporter ATP-binding protein [Streptomyces specialis]